MIEVRPAELRDLEGIVELYNHYVLHTPITFDIEPFTAAARRAWFDQFGPTGRYRLLTAVEADRVVGYAASLPYRPKRAYETSIETSVYCAADRTSRGLGTRLYTTLFEAVRGEDVHRALAGITLPNPTSVALHERFGFVKVGHYTEQGRKLGRYWDVAWFEKPMP